MHITTKDIFAANETMHRDSPARFDIASHPQAANRDDGKTKGIKICIWIYFWLLIFEGALRKWVLPGLANPLLLVKDPVVIAAYFIALTHGRFPFRSFSGWAIVMGLVTFVISLITGIIGISNGNLLVSLFGLRTNFLYLPFIFLIAENFGWEDLKKMGKWTLIVAVPMAVVVFLQFKSPSGALVNAGVGKSIGGQMDAGFGSDGDARSRASGLFSFNTGLATYLAMVASFVIHHFLQGGIYRRGLAVSAIIALAMSTMLSLSRGITSSVVLVFVFGLICVLYQPKLAKGLAWLVGGVVVLLVLLLSLRSVNEGTAMLANRFETSDGIKTGIIGRTFGQFTSVFTMLGDRGFFGSGLGLGTNVGSGLVSGGVRAFLVAEGEWERIVGEVGPVLGLAYIAFRVCLAFHVFRKALQSLKRGDSLAMLLFGAFGLLIMNGPLGTAQALGFMALGTGLILVAAKRGGQDETIGPITMAGAPADPLRPPRGRSLYAEQLHSGRGKP